MVTFISEAHDPTESAAEKSNYLRYTLPTPGAELLICFFAAFRVRYTEARRLVGVSLRPDGHTIIITLFSMLVEPPDNRNANDSFIRLTISK